MAVLKKTPVYRPVSTTTATTKITTDSTRHAVAAMEEAQAKYSVSEKTPPSRDRSKVFMLPGSSFLQLSKTWDQGSATVREKILRDLVEYNAKNHRTGIQLEQDFSNGASLFLTRISAWLRLTYLTSKNIVLQLQAIRVFILASSGARFLGEFLEVGGVLTLLEILGLSHIKEEDKAECISLLTGIANCGRKFKEFLCISHSVRVVADCMSKSTSEKTQDQARILLTSLGQTNPKFQEYVYKSLSLILSSSFTTSPTSQQMAAYAIRTLLPELKIVPHNLLEICFNLLKNPQIHVQFEAFEILKILLRRPEFTDPVLERTVAALKIVIGSDDASYERSKNKHKHQTLGAEESMSKEDLQKLVAENLAAYEQHAFASKLVAYIAVYDAQLGKLLVEKQVVSGLLNVISNMDHPESQRSASDALQFLAQRYPEVHKTLKENLGDSFVEILENQIETFFRELNEEQIRFLRRNNVQVLGNFEEKATTSFNFQNVSFATNSIDSMSSGNLLSADNLLPEANSVRGDGTIDANRVEQVSLIQESKEIKMIERNIVSSPGVRGVATVERMYAEKVELDAESAIVVTPFDMVEINNTFANNKFMAASDDRRPDEKFVEEFDEFRVDSTTRGVDIKKTEFKIDVDENLKQHMLETRNDGDLFSNKQKLKNSIEDDEEAAAKLKALRKLELEGSGTLDDL